MNRLLFRQLPQRGAVPLYEHLVTADIGKDKGIFFGGFSELGNNFFLKLVIILKKIVIILNGKSL